MSSRCNESIYVDSWGHPRLIYDNYQILNSQQNLPSNDDIMSAITKLHYDFNLQLKLLNSLYE